MSSAARRIGDLIEVPPVRTVIRLEEGRTSPVEITGSFVFTSEVKAHLAVIAEALAARRGQGYFLQGDFGSGKSHFLAALYSWLSGKAYADRLPDAYRGVAAASGGEKRVLVVEVSLIDYRAETTLEAIFLEAVERALAETGREVKLSPLSVFLSRLREVITIPDAARAFSRLIAGSETSITHSTIDLDAWITGHPREAYTHGIRLLKELGFDTPGAIVEDRRETFERIFDELEAAGFGGLVLLVDELSEFLRSKPTAQQLNEDARVLQFLGELTAERPLWIIGAVQESIESTGDIARAIIRKIKDRYPVKLTLSTVHIRSLIAERLVRKKPDAQEAILKIYEDYQAQFRGLGCSFDEFLQLYPIHPTTIALLTGLGDLFSQHRGIVDFVYSRIAGDERRGIPSILDRPERELLGPDSIYEHFSSRLAEFSAYNVYPRHIVPHLDEEISRILSDPADQRLAKRLIRILVLHRIHPTAAVPNAAKLAELVACGLDSPDLSARFVSEAILDPLAASSRFLRKTVAGDSDPAHAVYEISSEEDSGKVLEARIRRLEQEISDKDNRLLSEPLLKLPESDSWPGPALGRESMVREITWHASRRRALLRFIHPEEFPSIDFSAELETRECDFALLLTIGDAAETSSTVAVWQVPLPGAGETLEVLKEYLATLLLQDELSPSNPADAPLIGQIAERAARLKPVASQAVLGAFYAGSFSEPTIRVDSAVRQLKRFDSLVEAAGHWALPLRYPRFAQIAPRNYNPSARIYQQLLEVFVVPGSLPMSQARALGAAIEGLAVPLGLVEVKRNAYTFSPDSSGNPLLVFFFSLLRPSQSVALSNVLKELIRGVFGLPKDTALFLIASLAAGGLITVRRGGRAMALEFLTLQNVEKADDIALGELIGEHDRSTLLADCGFLVAADEHGPFGLRQQRDAWKAVIAFRAAAEQLSAETSAKLAERREYASFRGFPFVELEEKLTALLVLAKEIRVSYPAKEGLETFLAAFRSSGMESGDVHLLKALNRFLKRDAEKFVFVHHYMRHDAVDKIVRLEPELEELRAHLLALLEDPIHGVLRDECAELDRRFSDFRDRYLHFYASLHRGHYESKRPPQLTKSAERALQIVRRLAAVEALDRPVDLDLVLQALSSPRSERCAREVREELMRSPVCGCGFLPGQAPGQTPYEDPEKDIDRLLNDYLDILKSPSVLESLGSHAYAIRDLRPTTSAHLEELVSVLRSSALSPSALLGKLDEGTTAEIAGALSGSVTLRRLSLGKLAKRLAGRRLPPARIQSLVADWLGESKSGELIAIEGTAEGSSPAPDSRRNGPVEWWALANRSLFPGVTDAAAGPSASVQDCEEALERRFPGSSLAEHFRRMEASDLAQYILTEPLHTRAIETAWRDLTGRVMQGDAMSVGEERHSRHADPERAARIVELMRLTALIGDTLGLPFPDRLSLRSVIERLLAEPWTGADLKEQAADLLRRTEAFGERWLSDIAPVEPIDCSKNLLLLILDGVPPDVWLACKELIDGSADGVSTAWGRLDAEPSTVPATARLLGFEDDPVAALEAIDVPYLLLGSREEEKLEHRLASLPSGRAAVIRIGVFDRGAHKGVYRISDMAAELRHFLETKLATLLDFCRKTGGELILTTDHGLSLTADGLTHGGGGVYERAIFRAHWRRL